jgi:hypothetical protein
MTLCFLEAVSTILGYERRNLVRAFSVVNIQLMRARSALRRFSHAAVSAMSLA